MNYPSDQALMADPDFSAPQGAFPVWSKVFTKPREQTFIEITEHREAKASSAFIWVFLVGTLSGLISVLMQFILALVVLRQAAPEMGAVSGLSGIFGTVGLVGAICSAPLTGLMSVLGFAVSVAIIHGTAKFFGGQGTFDKLAYAFGAIVVPFSLVSGLLAPLNAIPFVVFCTGPLLLGVGIYVLYLQVTAIKAVHRLGWGESAGALLLPIILLAMLCGLAFMIALRVAGPSINEIFQQMQKLQ